MQNTKWRMLLGLILSLVIVLSATSCQGRNADPVSEPEETSSPGFINTLPVPDGPGWRPVELEKLSEMALEKNAINSDTVGWLLVPDTTVNDVIVWYPGDYNEYYLRRNFEKRYHWDGIYFADFRSNFDGTRDGLAQNTVIYGHSMEDDPNGPLFSQLKKYLDEDFAREHPYIQFSTLHDDMVWEVFAVLYSSTSFYYNTPVFSDSQQFESIVGGSIKRSVYTYDTQVTADDKILTLSTCCYNVVRTYPNNYRYVIMAKLVDETKPLKEEASFVKNPSPLDP